MSRILILYAGCCLIVLGGVAAAGWSAWDPFADGGRHHAGPAERTRHHGGYGGYYGGYGGGYGPMHK